MTVDEIRARLFLTVSEVAEILRADPRTVRRGIEAGEIPAVRVSSTVRVPVPALLSLLGETPVANDASLPPPAA